LHEAFQRIGAEFLEASRQPLAKHPLAEFIRHDAVAQIREALPSNYQGLFVHGSPGAGNWAKVPWIAIFDPAVTDTATRGYYIVYLFSADMQRVYLSFNQGTTAVHEEFGSGHLDELRRRASLARARVQEYEDRFSKATIDLASSNSLPKGYEAGHAFGKTYELSNLPSEETLITDLTNMVPMYFRLRARGGVLPLEGGEDSGDTGDNAKVPERRRYRMHRSIERNPSAGRQAKKIHGYICQACGFDFEAVYGELGEKYIEAHHLTPLAELPEDELVHLDPKTDFAVLCANCHRMIHRKTAPRTLGEFRESPKLRKFREKFGNG